MQSPFPLLPARFEKGSNISVAKPARHLVMQMQLIFSVFILSLQSIFGDVADNVSHPRRLDPTMELITYFFVLYLQYGRRDVKCKPSIDRIRNLFLNGNDHE